MNIEKKIIPKNEGNTQKLLNTLANEIAQKYGLDTQETKKLLLQANISKGLQMLKNDIHISYDKASKRLPDTKIQKLHNDLEKASKIIEKTSQTKINTLKNNIETHARLIGNTKNPIDKYLPIGLIQKARNPQNIHEHILGISLGTAHSMFTTVHILYQMGKGVLQSPYHLYLITTGKGTSNSFKNI